MLGRFAELFLFGLMPLALGGLLMPEAAFAEERVIMGEAFYRERIALPPDAVLTVAISELSLADAPGAAIAERTVDPAGQVPIKFELRFDPAVIRPQTSYALQARITVGDKLWFANDERHEIDPAAATPQKLLLKMARER